MPLLSKDLISQFINTGCKRQLKLYLFPDNQEFRSERMLRGMPDPQPPRPGLGIIVEAGKTWESEVLSTLTQVFGANQLIGNNYRHTSGQIRYNSIQLIDALRTARENCFIIEAQYEIGKNIKNSLEIENCDRHSLRYSELRPDIIEVLGPRSYKKYIDSYGNTFEISESDQRLQLRVIDIKLTSEPGPSYFAQVVYYSMALAGWLVDNGLENNFVVVPNGAIWPGTHEASKLLRSYRDFQRQNIQPDFPSLKSAMKEDLEEIPFEVFAISIRNFLQNTLPEVLPAHWTDFEIHIDNRCSNCEYLGYPWVNSQGQLTSLPEHCMPSAVDSDHLSRVAFLSRGATGILRLRGIDRVNDLADQPADSNIFEGHKELRASRSMISSRANVLRDSTVLIPPNSGTSAVMPKWADLRIYLSVDFDLSSALTFAFGIKAFYVGPIRPDGGQRVTRPWRHPPILIFERNVESERRELIAFLEYINRILTEARALDNNVRVQFYLWDSVQFDHIKRIIGRHLQAILNNGNIRHLAWLFPPDDLLPNPDLVATRSYITIVKDVIRSVLAAPIPHYYSLLEVARVYHDAQLPENIARFSIHPLFEDALSDQIPSERAHEIWGRSQVPHWQAQARTLSETVEKRLTALETVTKRLETELRPVLQQNAPEINIGPAIQQNRICTDGQIWLAYALLNDAYTEQEVNRIRAMPPQEREARYESAILTRRITGQQEQDILSQFNLTPVDGRRVYQMSESSNGIRMRENDINCALAPLNQSGFLNNTVYTITRGTPLQPRDFGEGRRQISSVTKATIKAIDRDNCFIVLDTNRFRMTIDDLENNGIVDFSNNVILDPIHTDFFTNMLEKSLRAIGNPEIARTTPLVGRLNNNGGIPRSTARNSTRTPPADVLWAANQMYTQLNTRDLDPIRQQLVDRGVSLNQPQWDAWTEAVSRRLQLIWGPPGTGKSRTAKAIIIGAAIEAYTQNRPMRILVSAFTYRALDNLIIDIDRQIRTAIPRSEYALYRLRSSSSPPDPTIPQDIDLAVSRSNPSATVRGLITRLRTRQNITIIGSTPGQIHNILRIINDNNTQSELFDLILIDEASQMDVAHSILLLCSLSTNGSIVLTGDPKQLPPIQQAEPPLGLANMVGSIYTLCRDVHNVPDRMLEINYRSNSTIIELSRIVGYHASLRSHSPNLRLHFAQQLPSEKPSNWPASLYWTPEWANILDPDQPMTCFIYDEGYSSQWNNFEADSVAALVYLLRNTLTNTLENELDNNGQTKPISDTLYSQRAFWESGIGIVTPHRAQQGLIIRRLSNVFGNTESPALIRSAVDTVERFQGQQRDVIIASYSLGDPDEIRDEDEFIMSLNRFNVMASRARAKLVVFMSRQIVDHLSSDTDVLKESKLLKVYADSFCNHSIGMTLGYMGRSGLTPVPGVFKYRRSQ